MKKANRVMTTVLESMSLLMEAGHFGKPRRLIMFGLITCLNKLSGKMPSQVLMQ